MFYGDWGSTLEVRKYHLLSWEKICMVKKWGGLGFRRIRGDFAFLLKGAWKFGREQDELWVRMFKKFGADVG